MPASKLTAFDEVAAGYDEVFSSSLIGHCQRQETHKWLEEYLENKTGLSILEINCGTGEDAAWLASLGHQVVATDASANMIDIARSKTSGYSTVQCVQSNFSNLPLVASNQQYDLIFSNFSGLNCATPGELASLNKTCSQLLKPGGHLAVVIFGKYCYWEVFYHLLKLQPHRAFRRWSQKPAMAYLNDKQTQSVYYYSISRFCRLFHSFEKKQVCPVGLFIPPSYLEGTMQKHKNLFRFLERLELKTAALPFFSQCADHCYLLLKKK